MGVIDAILVVVSSGMFIAHIAYSIGIKNWKLLSIMFERYNGARYIILVCLKLISLACSIQLLVNGGVRNGLSSVVQCNIFFMIDLDPYMNAIILLLLSHTNFFVAADLVKSYGMASRQKNTRTIKIR